AAKIAVGLTLDEITNPITGTTSAFFEPALDYVVTKFPRFPFDKFTSGDRKLGTQMKATGEIMAIGRNIEESLLKGVRSHEEGNGDFHLEKLTEEDDAVLLERVVKADDERMFVLVELMRRGKTIEEIHELTKIDRLFLRKINHILELEKELADAKFDTEVLQKVKRYGFSDIQIARVWDVTEQEVYDYRTKENIKPVYKMVDTCAAAHESSAPYFYSTYEQDRKSTRLNSSHVSISYAVFCLKTKIYKV